MAIEDYKITTEEINEKHVEAQPDELTGTPDENKSVFDTLVEFVVEKLNGLIDFLAGNFISASQISGGLSTDVDNNVTWKYEIVKGESQGINFSGTVNYNTKTIIKSSPLPFLTLRNAIVKIGDTEYLMDNGVFATESYSEYDGKFRLSSDATNTYITILDEAFSTAIGTYLTITVYVTSATTVPAKSLPLVVGEATGEFLQEQIDSITTDIGDMNLDTTATDLTGAINEMAEVAEQSIKHIAVSDSNGDFYINIGAALIENMILHIAFPASATDNTKNARLSIDGGTTYKNIFCDGVQVKAVVPESTHLTLYYDGTQFNIETKPKKTLWTGTWTSGAITVVGIDQYAKFDIYTANAGIMYGCNHGGTLLLAGNIYADATSGQIDTIAMRATISGNTVTMVRYTGFGHTQSSSHTGALSAGNITKIVGIY